MYLIFYGLYFTMVFSGIDIAFERSLEQALRGHMNSVSVSVSQLFSSRLGLLVDVCHMLAPA